MMDEEFDEDSDFDEGILLFWCVDKADIRREGIRYVV